MSKAFFHAAAVAIALVALACRGSPPPEPTATPVAPATPTSVAATATPVSTPTPEPTPAPTPTAGPGTITWPAGEVARGNTQRPELALTFDCGASGIPTPAILDALDAHGVRLTFFLTGQWVANYPDLTRRIAAKHELANHTYTHPDFRDLTDAQIGSEMERAEDIIFRTTGVNTRPLWRAPFGSRDQRILRAVSALGWTHHIYWSADSGDWRDISPQDVRANVNRAAQNGAIIVQHCGSTQTAEVVGDIISDLKARGFEVVTVSRLLSD
jgi:peptidoglycan/xylan/chitin deacetylase (PgdA/CDA1 family)